MRKGRANRKSRKSRVPAPKSAPQTGAEARVGGAASRAPTATELLGSVKTEASPKWDDQKAGRAELVTPIDPISPSARADEAGAKAPEPLLAEGAAKGKDAARADEAAQEPKSLEAVVTAVAATSADLAIKTPVDALSTNPDEISIPPAGDVAHVDEQFFSEGDLGKHLAHDDDAHWDADRAKVAKHAPHVVARREKFARYVRWAVAGAAVVCVAALARTVVTSRATNAPVSTNAMRAGAPARIEEAPKAAEPTAAAQPEAKPEAKAAEPTTAARPETKPAEPTTAAQPETKPAEPTTAAQPEAKPAEPAAAQPAPPADAKTALEEKNASRRALERGKLDDSIAAGERSVALDAEDGEAWLILGAAYQEKGKLAEARRCYSSCMKQGKRGPRHECAAMLR